MTELTIQFEAKPGVDVDALAGQLKEKLAAVPDVNDVQAEVMESRDLAVAATTIMAFITIAPQIVNSLNVVAKGIDGLTAIVNSIKGFVESSDGLRSAVVDIRGRRIPVSQLQPSDLAPTSGTAQ